MFCPVCRSEYREGFTHCPDCDEDLVLGLPELPAEAKRSDRSDDLVVVYSSNRMDAEMMRSVLEGSGIQAVNTARMGGGYPLTVGQLGAAQVLVKGEDEAAARAVLAAAQEGDLELPEEPDPPTSKTWVYAVAVFIVALLIWAAWESTGL